MKFDNDCARECLLWIEENVPLNGGIPAEELISALSYPKDITIYALHLLIEGGLVDGGVQIAHSFGGSIVHLTNINEITFEGQKYLNNIRDTKVWSETKNVASKIGGAALEQMVMLSANIVKKKLGLM